MPVWVYWALFFAVIGCSLLAAAWLDARESRPAAPAPVKDAPFERAAPQEIAAIEVPTGPAASADGLDEIVPGSRAETPEPESGPTKE